MDIARNACPYCYGDVMRNYKGRRLMGKCTKCSRIIQFPRGKKRRK